MPSPITISGTLTDGGNNPLSGWTVIFTLTNLGGIIPYVSGTSQIAQGVATTTGSNGTWAVTLWGVDQLTGPTNALWQYEAKPAASSQSALVQGNTIAALYKIVASNAGADLSTLTPVSVTFPPIVPYVSNTIIAQNAPSGEFFNGINSSGTFSYAYPPLNDMVNVKNYGALGNGSNDDTTAILNAMAACSSTAPYIYLPAGTYKISSTLTNGSALNCQGIVGSGSQTTIISTNGSWTGGNGIQFVPQVNGTKTFGLHFSGFQIVGPGAGSAATVTAWSTSGSVATITAANSFSSGNPILLQGFSSTNGSALNNNFATVISTGLSGSQFEFNSTVAANSGSETAVATLDWSGLAVLNHSTNSDGPENMTVADVLSKNWHGDGFKTIDSIVSTWKNCVAQTNGGNGFAWYSDNLTGGGAGGTSVHMDTCYANGNFKAGYYAYLLLYSSFNNCACDSNGAGYYMERCEGVGFYNCGFESLTYQNTSFPAHGFWIHGSRAVTIVGARCFIGSSNNTSAVSLQVDTTLTQGSQSSSNIGVHNFRITGSGGATQPTNDFVLDSNTSGCVIDGFTFFNATNFTNSGSNNRLWWNGSFRNGQTINAGGLTINAGGLTVSAGGVSNTGTLTQSGTVSVSGTASAGNNLVVVNGTTSATGSCQLSVQGALSATANSDLLAVIAAVPNTVNTNSHTGVKVYALRGVANNATYTGTPSITADVNADGTCTAGSTNYAFYSAGSNPSSFGGSLTIVQGGITVSAGGVAVTGNSTFTGTLSVTSFFGCNGATAVAPTTGYGTPTGNAISASFAAGSITLPNLAAEVAQLVLDLKKAGIIGA